MEGLLFNNVVERESKQLNIDLQEEYLKEASMKPEYDLCLTYIKLRQRIKYAIKAHSQFSPPTLGKFGSTDNMLVSKSKLKAIS
ncbi:CLUMA_CG014595, isoform A [Clunio marinus]|uniref:CLUMA_CG014595, isoform A n=1 Tax=Clunio marinus TaxID=568069 RepID=A0A1J1ILY7_9DIPT|nr:CLUMA_CG014595, isoform A [Clunio marinus]